MSHLLIKIILLLVYAAGKINRGKKKHRTNKTKLPLQFFYEWSHNYDWSISAC